MSASSAAPSSTEASKSAIGFIGLGVMGEPMCGHLARRSAFPVLAYDLLAEPMERLRSQGVRPASLPEIAATCNVICCRYQMARPWPR